MWWMTITLTPVWMWWKTLNLTPRIQCAEWLHKNKTKQQKLQRKRSGCLNDHIITVLPKPSISVLAITHNRTRMLQYLVVPCSAVCYSILQLHKLSCLTFHLVHLCYCCFSLLPNQFQKKKVKLCQHFHTQQREVKAWPYQNITVNSSADNKLWHHIAITWVFF